MVSGKIGEALVIAQYHAAVALAIPQAGLSLNPDIFAARFGHHSLHMVNEGLPACASIAARGFSRGEAASGAKYE